MSKSNITDKMSRIKRGRPQNWRTSWAIMTFGDEGCPRTMRRRGMQLEGFGVAQKVEGWTADNIDYPNPFFGKYGKFNHGFFYALGKISENFGEEEAKEAWKYAKTLVKNYEDKGEKLTTEDVVETMGVVTYWRLEEQNKLKITQSKK